LQGKPVLPDRLGAIDDRSALVRFLTGLRAGEGLEKLLPVALCFLIAGAALVSTLPSAHPVSAANASPSTGTAALLGDPAGSRAFGAGDGPNAPDDSDLYFGDGSIANVLQNRAGGADVRSLLTSYTVKAGDTLSKIAARFGLATTTIYWANKAAIPDPTKLHVGQVFQIPPMDGLIVKVGPKDTLNSLAAKYKIGAQDIIDANNLPEASVVLGESVIIPGASGGPIPKPKKPATNIGGGTVAAGRWRWPLAGDWYISQFYWSGHHAIDIAESYGSPVYAAIGGTVVFSGWRSYTGGGNVIWVETGPKLYTTYNHLSAWYVKPGQVIKSGQLIGRIGTSGVTTGPHLHFEVWLGYPWALGNNSDAVNPCIYLPNC